MFFKESEITSATQQVRLDGATPLDPHTVVVPDGVMSPGESARVDQLARELVQIFRAADYGDIRAGLCEVVMRTANLIFDDEESLNADHTIIYFSVISRFIGEFLWAMDSVSRGLYLDRLDEVANEFAEETPVPWFESGLPAIEPGAGLSGADLSRADLRDQA